MRQLSFPLLAALLAGCAALERPKPLAEADILALAQAARPSAEIVAELRRTHTVLALGASDILRLHEAGVPREVLDYLQRAQMEEIRWRARHGFGCCSPLYRGVGPCAWPPIAGPLRLEPWGCY